MESFRNRLTTVGKSGERLWVFAKMPKGDFTRYRSFVAYLCIAILFIIPFLKINGYPVLLLNVLERKFVLLGNVFWPQDFYILAFVLLSFFLFVILFTAIFGRVWCGWVCPQTVFMEMVFRKIEYWIEGDYQAQKRLHEQGWSTEKIIKRSIKYFIFVMFSYTIGNLVMCYLVGYENVFKAVLQGPKNNESAFIGVLAFSSIFFFVFAYLREQACTIICPYGRLQGVLLSKSSLVVAYDHLCGEPRGKNGVAQGDCVDCKLCVNVCPTGIDIRNGTQLECINCTACIDACDEIMTKLNKSKGLIRFDSLLGILNKEKWRMTPRIYLYAGFLTILLATVFAFLITRKNIDATLLRVSGQTYQLSATGQITNFYNLQLINKSFDKIPIKLKVSGLRNAELKVIGQNDINLMPESLQELVFVVNVPENNVPERKNNIKLDILNNNGDLLQSKNVSFVGPIK